MQESNFATDPYGIGIPYGSNHTTTEILSYCSVFLKTVPYSDRSDTLYWRSDINKYCWIHWRNMGERYSIGVARRCRLKTIPTVSIDDSINYFGGKYSENWQKYLTTSHRIQALSMFGGLGGFPKLLEIGCGSGHQLTALASYDIDVFGIDNNPKLIAECNYMMVDRVKFGDALLDTQFIFKRVFNFVVITMLGFVHSEDVSTLLLIAKSLLVQNGILILDAFSTNVSGTLLKPSTYKEIAISLDFKYLGNYLGQIALLKEN